MRLPWPFGRRSPSEGPSSAATEAGAAGVRPVDAGPSTSTPTRAWAALPPIQRTVGSAPLVAPSAPFLDDVPGHRPLPPMLQPLGHDAGPSGPPGLVVARSYPVPSLTSGTPMPPVQHGATARRGQAADATAAWPEPSSVPGADSAPSPSEAGDPVPVRHVAAVSQGAVATPPARPLTRATTLAPAGRPVASRSATGATPSSAAAAATTAWSTPADARTGEASSTTATSGTAAADPGLPLGPRRGASELSRAGDRASVPGGVPAPARRPGLGAPIAAAPTSAVAQRLPMRTPVRPHNSAAAASDARAAARTAATAGDGPDPAGPSSRASRLPVLPVARRVSGGAQASPAPVSAPSSSREVSTSPASHEATDAPGAGGAATAVTTGLTTRPTMGFRPLRSSIATRRDVETGSTGSAASPATPGEASTTPVAAHWGAGVALPDPVVSRSVDGGRTGPSSVQLTALGAAAPGPGMAVPSALPGEIVFPPRDAATDEGVDARPSWRDAGPDATTPAPWSSDRAPTIGSPAAGSPSAPGFVSRAGAQGPSRPLMLARSVAAGPAVAPSQGGSPGTPMVGRIAADALTPGPAPMVQTSAIGSAGLAGGAPVAAISATPIVQRVDGAAPPVESAPQGHSDTELDDLARALFGRIRTHLRAEVIHEREAKGLSFDAF